MKTFLKTLGLMVVMAFALVPAQILRADDDANVSFQTFYDQLANEGTWIQTDDYGYVFQPAVNDPNWRPYTYGHWVDTDQGMMWVSDEPFGWATYHYGRWVNLDNYGWVWVPGYTWAPAWVSWRDSDDYYGWAPLPPESAVGIDFADSGIGFGFGFHIGDDCDTAYDIGPAWYNFCPVAYIGDPHPWRHFADHRNNFALINRTRNVTNINVLNNSHAGRFGRVRADGPALAEMNAHSRTPLSRVQLTSASSLAANDRLHGHSLSVFAPNVNRNASANVRPHSIGRTLTHTNVNRGTDIRHSMAVTSRIQSPAPTAEQVRAATAAQGSVAPGAKIATASTPVSHPFTHHPAATFPPNATAAGSVTGLNQHQARLDRSVNAPHRNTVTENSVTGLNKRDLHATQPPHVTNVNPTPGTTFHRAHPTASAGQFKPARVTPPASGTAVHSFKPAVSSFHPQRVHQSPAPVFHSAAPAFHPSAPAFHANAPAFHAQPSFHPSAPAAHIGGRAPAAHVSGGGHPGGGHPGGGGRGNDHR